MKSVAPIFVSFFLVTAGVTAQPSAAGIEAQVFQSVEGRLPPGSVMKRTILELANGRQEVVDYAETPDGKAVIDGDIVIHVDESGRGRIAKDFDRLWNEGSASRSGHGGFKATGINGSGFRWRNNTVPFVISVGSAQQRTAIENALNHVEGRSAVRFVPRTNQRDFVAFVNTGGVCRSSVGRQGGRQVIELDPRGCLFGQIVHEIGHALGLWHEHQRSDRDSSVIVHWDNIIGGTQGNFEIRSGFWRCPFDFDSIMNYGSFFFAADRSRPTLTRRDGSTWAANRTALTICDSTGISDMYPRVRASIDAECYYPSECDLYGRSQHGVSPVTNWRWTIEDGRTTVIRTGGSVRYQFQNPGQHHVFLEITDSQGDRASAMTVVDIDPDSCNEDPCGFFD